MPKHYQKNARKEPNLVLKAFTFDSPPNDQETTPPYEYVFLAVRWVLFSLTYWAIWPLTDLSGHHLLSLTTFWLMVSIAFHPWTVQRKHYQNDAAFELVEISQIAIVCLTFILFFYLRVDDLQAIISHTIESLLEP